MAYTPYYSGGWQSGEEGGTPITPDALNHMEAGIEAANNDTVSVARGGTGADNASGALLNLGASFYLNTASWSDIYAKLSKIPSGHTAAIFTTDAVAKLLTGDKVGNGLRGTVSRTTTNGNYTFLCAYNVGQNLYAWRITGLTSESATPTIETVYQYSGTAI